MNSRLLVIIIAFFCFPFPLFCMEQLVLHKKRMLEEDSESDHVVKLARPDQSQLLILSAGKKTVQIKKEHALHCQTFKDMIASTDPHESIELKLDVLENTINDIPEYCLYGATLNSTQLVEKLKLEPNPKLARLLTTFTYLDSKELTIEIINQLASNLMQPDECFSCLTDAQGSFNLDCTADIKRVLAHTMLTHLGPLSELKQKFLTHEYRKNHNGSPTGPTTKLYPKSGLVKSLNFSPDNTKLLSAALDGRDHRTSTLQVFDMATLQKIKKRLTPKHTAAIVHACFSPDGTKLASGSADKTVCLWDAETHDQIGNPLTGPADSVLRICFNADGTQIAALSKDKTVHRWNVESQQEIGNSFKIPQLVDSISFNPDGTALILNTVNQPTSTAYFKTGIVETGNNVNLHPFVPYACMSPDLTKHASLFRDSVILVMECGDKKLSQELDQLFTHEAKPEIVSILNFLNECMSKKQTFDPIRYPGFAKIALPQKLAALLKTFEK